MEREMGDLYRNMRNIGVDTKVAQGLGNIILMFQLGYRYMSIPSIEHSIPDEIDATTPGGRFKEAFSDSSMLFFMSPCNKYVYRPLNNKKQIPKWLRVQNEQFSEEKGFILRYTEKEV